MEGRSSQVSAGLKREDRGSSPPTAVSKLGQFRSRHFAHVMSLGRDGKH